MLQEPMMENLTAMRLLGMVDALKAQEQDPAAQELSFPERFGLLVDQQRIWRENQALARRLHTAKLKGASVEDIDYRTSRGLDKSVIRALAQKSAWAARHENIFVLGPTGVGKSFVVAPLRKKPAAMVTPPSICEPLRCSATSPLHTLMGVCAACWYA